MLILKKYFFYTTIDVCNINPYFSSKAFAGICQSWRSKSSSDEEMTKAYSANTQTVDLRHPVKMAEAIDNQGLPDSQNNKSTDTDTLSNPVVNPNFARDIDNQPSKESNLSPEVIRSTVIVNPSHIPNLIAEALGNNKPKTNDRSVYGRKREEWLGGYYEEYMMINTSLDDSKPEVFPKNMC